MPKGLARLEGESSLLVRGVLATVDPGDTREGCGEGSIRGFGSGGPAAMSFSDAGSRRLDGAAVAEGVVVVSIISVGVSAVVDAEVGG